jgi:hypothetical protein
LFKLLHARAETQRRCLVGVSNHKTSSLRTLIVVDVAQLECNACHLKRTRTCCSIFLCLCSTDTQRRQAAASSVTMLPGSLRQRCNSCWAEVMLLTFKVVALCNDDDRTCHCSESLRMMACKRWQISVHHLQVAGACFRTRCRHLFCETCAYRHYSTSSACALCETPLSDSDIVEVRKLRQYCLHRIVCHEAYSLLTAGQRCYAAI